MTDIKVIRGRMTNAKFAGTNEQFKEACKAAGVAPTSRQASKYRRKMGKAYKEGRIKDVVVDIRLAPGS